MFVAPVAAMFALAGCGDDEPQKTPPSVVAFTADKTSVAPNETVKLTYEVSNANSVKITANPGGDLTLPAGLKGSVDSAPITANTTFTLTAVGDGGNATKSVAVTVTAANVQIVSFTGTPATIMLGQSATLAWNVANAETVKITSPTEEIVAAGTRFTDSEMVSPTVTTTYTLEATGTGGPRTQTVTVTVQTTPPRPTVSSFTASPNPITAGASSTLAWVVTDANLVQITDDAGASVINTMNLTGSVVVTPAATTTYTLVATSAANDTASQTVVLTVNASPTGATVNSFTATPASINVGQSTTLAWDVSNATGGIEIRQAATVLHTATLSTGTFIATPAAAGTVTYTLVAKNTAGDATSAVTVTVTGQAPTINSFTASPIAVAPNGSSTLSWDVTAATRIRILVGANVIFDNVNVTTPTGSQSVTVAATTTYTLEASNTHGTSTANVTVTVALPPVIDTFEVTPASFSGSSTVATATWTTTDATSTILEVNGVNVATFPGTPDGTFDWTVSQTSSVRLGASNGAVTVWSNAMVIAAIIVGPPTNTSTTTALQITGDGTGVAGTIAVANEDDWYKLDVPAGYGVQAWTDCVVDSQITLYDSTFVQLAFDDDGLPGTCSMISPATDVGARDLPAGTYYLKVSGYSVETGDYVLFTRVIEPQCGNGYRERNAGEGCDDGNTNAGDGCSASCVFEGTIETEPNDTSATATVLTLPAVVSGVIDPSVPDLVDFYAITIPAGSHLVAQASIDGFDSCPYPASAMLTLYDTDGTTILDQNSTGGPEAACGRLAPDTSPATISMIAGTYFIAVSDLDDDDLIDPYYLTVSVVAPGCGNGFIEGAEQCDDGNLTPGDGCSDACALEAVAVITGPSPTPTTIPGALGVGEIDTYRVEMAAPGYIRAQTYVPTTPNCVATTGSADTELELIDGAGTSLAYSDDHGGVRCSLIDPAVAPGAAVEAGTYFIRVSAYFSTDEVPAYELVVSTFGQGCGNGVIETALGEACDDGNLTSGDGCSSACAFEGTTETEPNDNSTVANTTSVPGVFAGALDPTGTDFSDFWSVVVPDGHSIVAYVATDSNGGCPNESVALRLFAPDGTTELAADEYNGPDYNCGRLAPDVSDATRSMEGGTYFLEVYSTYGEPIPAYFLTLDVVAPACGNGIVEATESCDDGNLTDGDGCSALCAVEAVGTYVFPLPGGIQTFTDAIDPAEQVDFFVLELTEPGYLTAGTFDDGVAQTCAIDTVLRLYDAQRQELYYDDESGVGSCSQIPGLDTSGNLDLRPRLEPGRYYLSVESWYALSTIPRYDLIVSIEAVDVCGNGETEPSVGEQCDDGNVTDGDGCAANCSWETLGTFQAPSGSGTITGLAPNTYRLFQINIGTDGESVQLVSHDAADPSACTVGTRLYLIDDQSRLVTLSNEDVGQCGTINAQNLAAGTYFVAVLNEGTVAGDIGVDATFTQPGCGNGIIEALTGESCDDGNLVDGDGCSAACAFEGFSETEPNDDPWDLVAPSFNETGLVDAGTITISGVIPAGSEERDYFMVEIPVGQTMTISAHTYRIANDPASECPVGTVDTAIKIWSPIGDQLEYNDDINYPANVCSSAQTVALPEGQYYVSVASWEFEAYGAPNGGGTMAYFLDITLAP
ncbi:MAG: DUF4215 domain-containing protein [Deltaproteobacteria bacterium]|nr:DUF4215 domain-containing protein [Deltaproteobacteria bacterium]